MSIPSGSRYIGRTALGATRQEVRLRWRTTTIERAQREFDSGNVQRGISILEEAVLRLKRSNSFGVGDNLPAIRLIRMYHETGFFENECAAGLMPLRRSELSDILIYAGITAISLVEVKNSLTEQETIQLGGLSPEDFQNIVKGFGQLLLAAPEAGTMPEKRAKPFPPPEPETPHTPKRHKRAVSAVDQRIANQFCDFADQQIKAGNPSEAAVLFRTALDRDPENIRAKKGLE